MQRIAVLLRVQRVHRLQRRDGGIKSLMRGQRGEVEIIAGRVAFKAKKPLDPQYLRQGRKPNLVNAHAHRGGFQRLGSAQLANAGLDAVKRTENEIRTPDSRRLPTGHGFKIDKNGIKTLPQIGQHMIVVERKPMTGV